MRTHFSSTFARKDRLLIGRLLVAVNSSPAFFNRGLTTEVFQCLTKTPFVREILDFTKYDYILGKIHFLLISWNSCYSSGLINWNNLWKAAGWSCGYQPGLAAVLKVLGLNSGCPRIFKIDFHQQKLHSLSIACDVKLEGALYVVSVLYWVQ